MLRVECLPAHTAVVKVQLCKTISHAWHGSAKVVQSFQCCALSKLLGLVAVSICWPCLSEVIVQHARSAPDSCASPGQAVISLPRKAHKVVSELSDYTLVSRCSQCASKHQCSACSTASLSVPFACQPFIAMAHLNSSVMCICKRCASHLLRSLTLIFVMY